MKEEWEKVKTLKTGNIVVLHQDNDQQTLVFRCSKVQMLIGYKCS